MARIRQRKRNVTTKPEAGRERLAPAPARDVASPQTAVASLAGLGRILRRKVSSTPAALLPLHHILGNRCFRRLLAKARGPAQVSPEVEAGIERARGGGQPLDGGVRGRMESAFGVGFQAVRVHTGPEAGDLSNALAARAFTTGRDIFFGRGQYRPESAAGKELIAHELTHVVQQAGTEPRRKLVVGEPGDVLEQEADRAARAVMTQQPADVERRDASEGSASRQPAAGGAVVQLARLRDYEDADPAHDPSRLTDAQIEATNEYRAYMDPTLVWQRELHVTAAEARLACRLILRAIRQGEAVDWQTGARRFVGIARRQMGVTTEAASMVGSTMTWRPSGPGSGTDVETWASAASEAAAPPVASSTVLNCWEMVLLAAYRAHLVTWQWIHDTYVAAVPNWSQYLVGRMSRGSQMTYTVGSATTARPLRGDIVFFNGVSHVALATGERDGLGRSRVISFWPPPGTSFTPGGTLDSVKVTTIEELVDWWTTTAHWAAPAVRFATAPW